MDEQPEYSIVKEKEIPFTQAEILKVILVFDVPKREPSFTDRVDEIPSCSQINKIPIDKLLTKS